MTKTNLTKSMTFIQDLPGIEKVNPLFMVALEESLFKWTESMLPYYHEMKERNADVFICENVTAFGNDWGECYEKDGIHYRFDNTPLWGKTLSLNSQGGYRELNWRGCFWNEFPEFHGVNMNHFEDNHFFHWYFYRYHKKDSKYNIVTDRLRDYFKQLTGDSDIVFDVGWKSFIYSSPRIKNIIDYSPSLYY